MADLLYMPLLDIEEQPRTSKKTPRVASLDVFRGLCVFLMMLVDYGGAIFPIIAHSPWNGLHLADFVMPFFLFIAGVSLALVYKRVPNRIEATRKAVLRAAELFLLGVILQGGYLHGINSLTYGVDMKRIRWLGILQRISVGYIFAALCEIWLSCRSQRDASFLKSYYWHWGVAFSLSAMYLGLLYGLYVPDWQFEMSTATSSVIPTNQSYVYMVKCSFTETLRSAICPPMAKSQRAHLPGAMLRFDPEGVLSSITAAVACIIGLQYGHSLAHLQDHKQRMQNWILFSLSLLVVGLLLAAIGDPVNKSLYTFGYMLITSASAGITYSAIYLLVDVYGHRCLTFFLEWMGKHSLSIFVLITSNLAVIAVQGFYWKAPENNLIHWIVSRFVHS
ncbi:hypothetical protein OIU78_001262 [Salix suchowensis]|nr:hypothetical protein OIU78_001262 [Salix suchowensis]